ncbi:MAG: substrate-binding domain-containing protein [Azoarcus sp.]|nr:substrate-binding domain-containing protein [Azoarcus sp.]
MKSIQRFLAVGLLGAASQLAIAQNYGDGTVCNIAGSADLTIAVASNFYYPAQAVAAIYQYDTGNVIKVCHNATGILKAAIITDGANITPYDAFLAADNIAPGDLANVSGLTAAYHNSATFNYTKGIPVLWTPVSNVQLSAVISAPKVVYVANPANAPYGVAAQTILNNAQTGQYQDLVDEGQETSPVPPYAVVFSNIELTYQEVNNANSATVVGFVAKSQICGRTGDSRIAYPSNPTTQDGVIINHPAKVSIATDFVDLLLDTPAQNILQNSYCYLPRLP